METYFPNFPGEPKPAVRKRLMRDIRTLARDSRDLRTTLEPASGGLFSGARLRRGIARIRHTIVSDPFPAIGIAFALGISLGALLRRRP